MDLPPVPPALKPISAYLKLAKEYDKRDPIVSYFCRVYSIQKGISTDSKSPDCKAFLLNLMDNLEKVKKNLTAEGHEAVTNEIVGQAHLEGMALNLFNWADKEDRKSNFNKGLVKAFYSANLLFDVIKQFGDIGDEIAYRQRYAKWKATYIHKCLQTGETPVPGPQGSEFEGAEFNPEGESSATQSSLSYDPQPPYPTGSNVPSYPAPVYPGPSSYQEPRNDYPSSQQQKPTPSYTESLDDQTSSATASSSTNSKTISADDYQQATKYCKYAISAMQYEDVNTAIDNLAKALSLLKNAK